jgi:RNA polymerase sigma-70 factor, ECF subfamily
MQADLARVEHAITAVKAGDPSALHYLYVRYADVVSAYVSTIVGGGEEAEDVTQSVFHKLPRAIAAYEAGGLPFEGWLLRMARSSALDFLRTSREMSPEQLEVLALRHLARPVSLA